MTEENREDKKYKYDVAISFLAEDENIARILDNLLKKRLSTFVYYDRQKELAGTNGEDSFSRIFGLESRLSVVLYGDGWGSTPFTRIEETAIRNRGFDNGYDFVTFVMLDGSLNPPKWLPKNRLWYDYETYGIERLVPVVEARAQDAGGDLRVETLEEQVVRLEQGRVFALKRRSLLDSAKGVEKASQEVQQLLSELERITTQICSTGSGIKPTFGDLGGYRVRLNLGPYYTEVSWHNSVLNTLSFSNLTASTYEWNRGINHTSNSELIDKIEYNFDFQPEDRFGWIKSNGEGTLLTSRLLAHQCIKKLLDLLEGNHPW